MRISRFFTAAEVARSHTASRLGIDNTPPPEALERAKVLAQTCLDFVREEFGPIRPQSWYRCEALERAITWNSGFKSWCRRHNRPQDESAWAVYFSRKSHPKGEAVDLEIAGVSNDDLYWWIRDNLQFDQLIREFPKPRDPMSGWVHVSKRARGDRGRAFSIPWNSWYA